VEKLHILFDGIPLKLLRIDPISNAGTYTVDITDAEGVKHTERIVIQPPYPLILDQINTKDATCGSASDGYAKISVKIGRGEPYKIFLE